MPLAAYPNIILVGGGHAHLAVLHDLANTPEPAARVTLISPDTSTAYSGMLPGYVAGCYSRTEVFIDAQGLARRAQARFVTDEVTGINLEERVVHRRHGPPLSYDLLSLNTGSRPQCNDTPGAAEFALASKPVTAFQARWQAYVAEFKAGRKTARIAVVGGGAAGVELAFAMHERLSNEIRDHALGSPLRIELFSADACILAGHGQRSQRLAERLLTRCGIGLHRNAKVCGIESKALILDNGRRHPADLVVWATSAEGLPWLAQSGLALDERGFVLTADTLQSLSHPEVFAAGDCASVQGMKLPKSGVVAVRQGKVLAANLRRRLHGQPLLTYRPQRRWLALLRTGNGQAIASWGEFAVHGRWVWRWKQWIDRGFMVRLGSRQAAPITKGSK